MAEPKFQLNFHDGRRKCLGGGVLNRFHGSKTSHATTGYNIGLVTLKASMIACLVSINKENSKWSLDGKMINEFGRSTTAGIGKCTARTGITHLLDVGVHFWQEVT